MKLNFSNTNFVQKILKFVFEKSSSNKKRSKQMCSKNARSKFVFEKLGSNKTLSKQMSSKYVWSKFVFEILVRNNLVENFFLSIYSKKLYLDKLDKKWLASNPTLNRT